MEKIKISTQFFLVEGGCNACGMINCATYTLHFEDGKEAMTDQLDPVHLSQSIAIKDGWREHVESVGIGEDAFFLKKEKNAVEISEDSFKTTFKKFDGTRLAIAKKECELAEVMDQTNTLLVDFFELPAYEFELMD
ncbi:DUF4809 family protein [Enterococcus timonensis]|uniref:DUF4809 family protein n=1 Tax=Enterococcus timonensis TaxID=1852364 RepID=UPI0008D8E1D6|nr:DUF4809 family protein [Enterococcus timonensis]